jgi:hypothetical protein
VRSLVEHLGHQCSAAAGAIGHGKAHGITHNLAGIEIASHVNADPRALEWLNAATDDGRVSALDRAIHR